MLNEKLMKAMQTKGRTTVAQKTRQRAWDILSALRGEDRAPSTFLVGQSKASTTGVIRQWAIAEDCVAEFAERMIVRSLTPSALKEAIIVLARQPLPELNHFGEHVGLAVRAICKLERWSLLKRTAKKPTPTKKAAKKKTTKKRGKKKT
jgi:hypothetical protein